MQTPDRGESDPGLRDGDWETPANWTNEVVTSTARSASEHGFL